MTTVDISVLVVSHNHENYIDQALASISDQRSSLSIEVVIADDHSTDSTLEKIRAWEEKAGMTVRVLEREPRLGITRNYERGFRACSGRFIAVLEGDDEWISVEKLELQSRYLDENPDVVLVANRFLLHHEDTGESLVQPTIGTDNFSTPITSEQLAEANWFGTFSTCMFRASALAQVAEEVFEETSYDWMTNLAITEHGDAAFLPEVTALYRVHRGGAWSGKSTPQQDLELQALIPRYMELLGGRLDRQLSGVLVAAERRLERMPAGALDSSSTPKKPATSIARKSKAPERGIPRVATVSRPAVSVVMTSYNHADFIREAIDSVLQQTMSDLELVIVDDHSTDHSLDVISTVTDPRVRVYRLGENIGAAAALNLAIQQTRGDLVAVINSDDRWELHKLARQQEVLAQKPDVGAVFTGVRIVDEKGHPLAPNRIPAWMEVFRQPNRSQGQWLRYFLTNGNALCHPSILIKRKIYEEIGLYDNSLRQLPDFDRWIALVKHCPIDVLGDEPLVRFRTFKGEGNASSLSSVNVTRTYHEHQVINERFFDGVTAELLVEGFADELRLPFLRTQFDIDCAVAFLWLDCSGPLHEINRAEALAALRRLLRHPRSKLYLHTRFDFRDVDLQVLAGVAEGARTLDAFRALTSIRETPERLWIAPRFPSRFASLLRGMRRTPLRQWPGKIRRRLSRQ